MPLSFEEYCVFLYPGRLYGNQYRYSIDLHQKYVNKMSSVYGTKGADLIHKIGLSYSYKRATKKELFTAPEKHLDAIRYSYERIQVLPLYYLTESIGFGFTGIVFQKDDNTVIKQSYDCFCPLERRLYYYLQRQFLPVFPRVYSVTENYVVMEKLDTDSQRIDLYRGWIKKYIEHKFIEEIGYREIKGEIAVEDQEFKDFVNELRKAFLQVFGIDTIGDLTPSNIGERLSSGEIVLFDPIDGLLAKQFE